MLNISKFISENVTFRKESLFKADIENNKEQISREVEGKSLCVIGGAGSIGSSFIKAILPFKPSKLVVSPTTTCGRIGKFGFVLQEHTG